LHAPDKWKRNSPSRTYTIFAGEDSPIKVFGFIRFPFDNTEAYFILWLEPIFLRYGADRGESEQDNGKQEAPYSTLMLVP
jgi:hypothetical protein